MPPSSPMLSHQIRDVTIVNFEQTAIIDTEQVRRIGEQLQQLVGAQARRKIVLDFSKVRALSSSALGVLITAQKTASEAKGQVVLCGLRKDLRKVFKIAGLNRMFTFCNDEEAALAKFGVTTAG